MARVPASLALMLAPMLALSLSLAACGSPEATPDEASAPTETAATSPAQTPGMPDDAPPQEEEDGANASGAASCSAEIGTAPAVRLAERCTLVSPASHPPCNPDNPCALIQGEIDRACAQYGSGEAKPAECAA
jgi:hypothetical protein